MSARAIRKIGQSLIDMADDPETITDEALRLAIRRIAAQVEMIEDGINTP